MLHITVNICMFSTARLPMKKKTYHQVNPTWGSLCNYTSLGLVQKQLSPFTTCSDL